MGHQDSFTTARADYDRDGFYLHQQSVLAPDLLARAAQGLEDVRNAVYDTGEEPTGRGWNPGDDPQALCKLEMPQLSNHALREALRAPELGRLVGAISGAQTVQVWWVQLLYKPGVPEGAPAVASDIQNIGWHQDRDYWRDWNEGAQLFTAWLALSDVTLDAGPMMFVRGSHRWGLLEGGNFFSQDQESIRGAITVPPGEEWREVPAVLPPGGVSFHDRLLFHGSTKNLTNRPRRSLAIHLRTENSRLTKESWMGRYLDRPEICPVIFDRASQ